MSSIATAATPENRNRMLIMAAVAFAAIAAVLVFVALQRGDGGGGSTAAADVPVVVASREIPANTVITEEMLDVRSVAPDQLLSGAYGETELVVGSPARFLIQEGQQITARNIGADVIEDEKDLALVLEPGMRGFAVEVKEVTAVGGLLLPGNHVDVIAVREDTAVMVMQNVQVLSVAQVAQEPIAPSAEDAEGEPAAGVGQGQRPEDIERQPSARSVTLALTPQQSVELALLQDNDDTTIWLSLRPAGDEAAASFTGVSFIEIFPVPPAE